MSCAKSSSFLKSLVYIGKLEVLAEISLRLQSFSLKKYEYWRIKCNI